MSDELKTPDLAQVVSPAQDELYEVARALAGQDALDQLPVQFGPDEIEQINPHRFELVLLSGVSLLRPDLGLIAGFKNLGEDEFWARCSRDPVAFPPSLMLETAGQLCSFYWQKTQPQDRRTFALGEIKRARFYAEAGSGQRLMVVAKAVNMNRRKAEFDVAGFLGTTRVFDATIVGMALG